MTQTLLVNEYGRRKAERFRRHFDLSTDFYDTPHRREWIDAHDYLHTVLGARPEDMDDEMRVLMLYESIIAGHAEKPRGLL